MEGNGRVRKKLQNVSMHMCLKCEWPYRCDLRGHKLRLIKKSAFMNLGLCTYGGHYKLRWASFGIKYCQKLTIHAPTSLGSPSSFCFAWWWLTLELLNLVRCCYELRGSDRGSVGIPSPSRHSATNYFHPASSIDTLIHCSTGCTHILTGAEEWNRGDRVEQTPTSESIGGIPLSSQIQSRDARNASNEAPP